VSILLVQNDSKQYNIRLVGVGGTNFQKSSSAA